MNWAQRLVADLSAHGAADVATIARRMGVPSATISERLRRAHRGGHVHIVAWHGAQRGVYAAGAGTDAPRPVPRTVAQRSRKYRTDPVNYLSSIMARRRRHARRRKPPPQSWLSALQ